MDEQRIIFLINQRLKPVATLARMAYWDTHNDCGGDFDSHACIDCHEYPACYICDQLAEMGL